MDAIEDMDLTPDYAEPAKSLLPQEILDEIIYALTGSLPDTTPIGCPTTVDEQLSLLALLAFRLVTRGCREKATPYAFQAITVGTKGSRHAYMDLYNTFNYLRILARSSLGVHVQRLTVCTPLYKTMASKYNSQGDLPMSYDELGTLERLYGPGLYTPYNLMNADHYLLWTQVVNGSQGQNMEYEVTEQDQGLLWFLAMDAIAFFVHHCPNLKALDIRGPHFRNGWSYDNAKAAFSWDSEPWRMTQGSLHSRPINFVGGLQLQEAILSTLSSIHLDVLSLQDFGLINHMLDIPQPNSVSPLSNLLHFSVRVWDCSGRGGRRDRTVLPGWPDATVTDNEPSLSQLTHPARMSALHLATFLREARHLRSISLHFTHLALWGMWYLHDDLRSLTLSRVRIDGRRLKELLALNRAHLSVLHLDQIEITGASTWAVAFREMAKLATVKGVLLRRLHYNPSHRQHKVGYDAAGILASKGPTDNKDLRKLMLKINSS